MRADGEGTRAAVGRTRDRTGEGRSGPYPLPDRLRKDGRRPQRPAASRAGRAAPPLIAARSRRPPRPSASCSPKHASACGEPVEEPACGLVGCRAFPAPIRPYAKSASARDRPAARIPCIRSDEARSAGEAANARPHVYALAGNRIAGVDIARALPYARALCACIARHRRDERARVHCPLLAVSSTVCSTSADGSCASSRATTCTVLRASCTGSLAWRRVPAHGQPEPGFGVVRNPEYPPAGGGSRRSAREILDERLARGEIDSGEYDRLREKLEQAGTPQNPTPT